MTKFCLAESPLWHPRILTWIWTDILDKHIYESKDIDSIIKKPEHQTSSPQMVSNLIILTDDSLLVSAENCLMKMDSKTARFESLIRLPHSDLFRCNDGSVGPDGKYWFGTMEKEPTSLSGEIYALDKRGQLIAQSAPIGIPNSFIWIDSFSVLISDSFLKKTFKVNLKENSALDWANRVVWLDFSDTDYTPDGGALDEDGNVWLAIWGGAAVHKYSPDGELLDKIQLQALQPTSCAFGGANMDMLLITTATEGLSPSQLKEYPDSGKILQRQLSVKGKIMPNFELQL